jgi:hypothetical protein
LVELSVKSKDLLVESDLVKGLVIRKKSCHPLGLERALPGRLSVAARDLLTRLPLLSSLLEQIIQGGIDPSLVNVAPQRAIGSNDPVSAVFLHDLDAVNGGCFPSVS